MIYCLFWLVLSALKLPFYCIAIILIGSLLVCPRGQRRYIVYGLILAFVIGDVQRVFLHYNDTAMPATVSGYVYRINGNKADIYIDNQKYKLKAKGLTDQYEGQCIQLQDVTIHHQKTLNHHSYNYQQHYQLLGYHGYLNGRLVNRVKKSPDRILNRLSFFVRGVIIDFAESLTPRAKVLTKALLLGEIDDNKLLKQVKSLGLLHLFVISGFHFAAIAGLLLFVLQRLFKLPYKLSIVSVVILILCYLTIIKIGFGSLRASIALIVGFFCFFVKRKADSVQIALFFVFITLLINTVAVFDLGFQLTTLTYIAVVMTSRKLKRWSCLTTTLQGLIISVVVFATIGSVLIYSQGSVALSGVLLVPLLTPLIGVFIILTIIGLPINMLKILPYYSWVLSFMADRIYDFILWSEDLAILTLQFSPIIAMSIVIVMIATFMAYLLTNRGWHLADGLAIGLLISGLILFQQVNFGLAINSYALYDGEAYLIRAPGAVVMYDVGNSPEILPILRRSGITKLDAIIISHPHQDHDGMLQAICQQFDVARVITEIDDDTQLNIGALKLYLCQAPQGISNNLNDSSIACHLQYGAFDMLFTGDMEEASTSWLIEHGLAPVEVLKVPHHGSFNKRFLDLLKGCQAQVAIIAGGGKKRIDKSKIYHILETTETPFCDTMPDGEICIKVRNNHFTINTYNQKNIVGDCLQ